MSSAQFERPAADAMAVTAPRMKWGFLWEYLRERDTPLRNLNDIAVRSFMPFLEGPGTIIELGAGDDSYKKMLPPTQKYELTNLYDPNRRQIDMAKMDLPDASVDAFVSILALEHVFDHAACLKETYRCLKPGGRMILAAPFLCYYHGAPDDYFRFTDSGLNKLLKDFTILKSFSMGNRGLLMAMSYYEHPYMGSTKPAWARSLLRIAALPFLAHGIAGNQSDHVYALTHAYLCEKPQHQ
jgi:SAM-dependent methyltransferase